MNNSKWLIDRSFSLAASALSQGLLAPSTQAFWLQTLLWLVALGIGAILLYSTFQALQSRPQLRRYLLVWLIVIVAVIDVLLLLAPYFQPSWLQILPWLLALGIIGTLGVYIGWLVQLRPRVRRYLLLWLVGAAGVFDVIMLLMYRLVVGSFDWERGRGWDWITHTLDRITYPSQAEIYASPYDKIASNAFRWLIVWLLIVVVIYIFRWPDDQPSAQILDDNVRIKRRRIRYLTVWLVGIIVLLPFSSLLLDIVVPSISHNLLPFTKLSPLIVIWSILVFLAFLQFGDGSDSHTRYLVPHRSILMVLTLVVLATFLTGYQAYQGISARVNGELSARVLAGVMLDRLRDSTQATIETAHRLDEELIELHRIDGELQRQARNTALQPAFAFDTALMTNHSGPQPQTSLDGKREETYNQLVRDMSSLKLYAMSAHTRAQDVLPHLDTSAQHTSYHGTSVAQVRYVVTNIVTTTTSLTTMLPSLEQAIIGLRNPTTPTDDPDRSAAAVSDMLHTALVPAERADEQALIALESIRGVRVTGLITFLWLTGFYTAFVLFPWVLLLMFLYRKRTSRAANILTDLMRLDPKGGLVKRVINGAKLDEDEADLLSAVDAVAQPQLTNINNQTVDMHKRKLVGAMAGRAFNSFEYIISLLLLSFLTAVGWYYMFYPRTSFGLAMLIESGSGIKELTAFIVDNITPLTMGFAGASFFSIGMLGRRYLADDLYPSAFLQAAQRLIVVFILSLFLAFLSPALRYNLLAQNLSAQTLIGPEDARANLPTTTLGGNAPGSTADTITATSTISPALALLAPPAPSLSPTDGPQATPVVPIDNNEPPGDPNQNNLLPGQAFLNIVLAVLAFFAGISPTWAVRGIAKYLSSRKWLPWTSPDIEPQPLTKLSGITVWSEARLLEENVENIQALATASIEQLVLGTHYPTSTIIDWVDQAILYMHAGHNGDYFASFQSAGVPNASKLLDAAGIDLLNDKQFINGTIDTHTLKVDHLIAGVEDTKKPIPEAVLRTIIETIWPNQNLAYIVNYYRERPAETPTTSETTPHVVTTTPTATAAGAAT